MQFFILIFPFDHIFLFLEAPKGKFPYLLAFTTRRSKVRICHRAALLELKRIQCLAQGHFSIACQWESGSTAVLTSITCSVLAQLRLLHMCVCVFYIICIFFFFLRPQYFISPAFRHSTVHRPQRTLRTHYPPTGSWELLSDLPRRNTGQLLWWDKRNQMSALKIRQCGKRKMSSLSRKHPNHKLLLETWRLLIMGINCATEASCLLSSECCLPGSSSVLS